MKLGFQRVEAGVEGISHSPHVKDAIQIVDVGRLDVAGLLQNLEREADLLPAITLELVVPVRCKLDIGQVHVTIDTLGRIRDEAQSAVDWRGA